MENESNTSLQKYLNFKQRLFSAMHFIIVRHINVDVPIEKYILQFEKKITCVMATLEWEKI